jgi:prepilin-type N-terminal cleavage/methylation domain-containing protein
MTDQRKLIARETGIDGFSLMEIMVTLAIISIVVSLVTASLSNSLQSARFAALTKAAVAEVRNYRAKALLSGQSAVIVTDTSASPSKSIKNIWRLPLPPKWTTEGAAIEISPSGMCLGGEILMINPRGRRALYRFDPPECIPKRVAAAVKAAS